MKSPRALFSSQFRINMASGVVATAFDTGAMAVSYPAYLHFLGLQRYGLWVLLSIVFGMSRLATLGIPDAVMKLSAEERGQGNHDGVGEYYSLALACLAGMGGVALLALIVFRNQIAGLLVVDEKSFGDAVRFLPYVAVLSIYMFVAETTNALLSGLGRMDLANMMQSLSRVMVVAVSIAGLAAGFDIYSLLLGSGAGYLTNHVGSLICIKRIWPYNIIRFDGLNSNRLERLVRFGGGTFGIWVLSLLLHPFNKIVLSRYVGMESLPIYDFAAKGSMQVRGLMEVMFRAVVPEVSAKCVAQRVEVRQRILSLRRRSFRLIVGCGLPLMSGLWLLAPLVFRLWLGHRYSPEFSSTFRIILAGAFFSLMGVPSYYILLGLGHVRDCVVSNLVQALTNGALVVICVAFIPSLAVQHVAGSLAVGMLVTCVFLISRENVTLQKLALSAPSDVDRPRWDLAEHRQKGLACHRDQDTPATQRSPSSRIGETGLSVIRVDKTV